MDNIRKENNMEEKYFLVQIQRKNSEYTKGVVVKDSLDACRQSFHAYLGAYGYGNDPTIDYVACYVIDMAGLIRDSIVDNRIVAEPEEPEQV
jgi:hypothetical protein